MASSSLNLKAQRILVTGGAGFLGSFVVDKLKQLGIPEVDIFVPRSRDFDLRDQVTIKRLFATFTPTVIFHLAANCGGIGANQAKSDRFFYDNAIMGIELMEQALKNKVKKYIQVGTVCAYPAVPRTIPFIENELWDGYPEPTNASYGLAKRILLEQAQVYRAKHPDFNPIYLLPANLYGPRDHFDPTMSHVIPAMIRKFIEAKSLGNPEVTLWGSGTPTREFLYVEDAAEGIVLAAEHYDKPEPCNLGTGQEISIKDLANEIKRLTNYQGNIVWDKNRPNGQLRRVLNIDRANEFKFKASTPLSKGLEATIQWFNETLTASQA